MADVDAIEVVIIFVVVNKAIDEIVVGSEKNIIVKIKDSLLVGIGEEVPVDQNSVIVGVVIGAFDVGSVDDVSVFVVVVEKIVISVVGNKVVVDVVVVGSIIREADRAQFPPHISVASPIHGS